MDEIDTGNRAQRAQALLGLRLDGAESVAVGEEPSAEDFAALYEGQLDATRRAQVLSHIASDPDIYRRWIDAVSAQASMDESLMAATPGISAEREPAAAEPFLQRALAWFMEGFRTPALVGSVSAAALVAILVIPGGEQPTEQAGEEGAVAQLYSQFGGNWQVSPATLPDRMIRSTNGAKDYSVQQQALYLGLKDGVDALGEGFPTRWLPAVDAQLSSEQLHDGTQVTYYELGKLAAIARFQCQLEGEDAFFLAAQDLMDKTLPELEASDSDYGRRLSRVIKQPGTASERVCDFASAAVALLSQK